MPASEHWNNDLLLLRARIRTQESSDVASFRESPGEGGRTSPRPRPRPTALAEYLPRGFHGPADPKEPSARGRLPWHTCSSLKKNKNKNHDMSKLNGTVSSQADLNTNLGSSGL